MIHWQHLLPFLALGSILGWIDDHTLGYLGRGWQWAVQKVKEGLHALTSWIQTIVSHVGDAWDTMVDGFVAVRHALNWLASEVYGTLGWVIQSAIPGVYRWASGQLSTLAGRVQGLAQWAARTVAGLIDRIAHAAQAVQRWVTANVYRPLAGWVKDIYVKLREWAWTAWQLVTHPQRLAALVWRYIVIEIANGADWTAKWLGLFVVRVWLNNLPRLVGFVESFFADLL